MLVTGSSVKAMRSGENALSEDASTTRYGGEVA